jgi:hypothetical protein
MSFEAKYSGHCATCEDKISVGDECSYDKWSEIQHADCRPPIPQVVCDICFLTSCDCRRLIDEH